MKSISSKIYNREALIDFIQKEHGKGKKIGLTNGTFDILHAGHVLYLEAAKKICDILVVSLNTDISVRKYKDDSRPINPQQDRAIIIASLESVDYVTFHNEEKMQTTLELLRPDLYIKGGDYTSSSLTSSHVLKKWGGEVKILPFIEGKSTSNIINKIQNLSNTTISLESASHVFEQAVILDRDGVINEEVEYLHTPEKFQFIKNALVGIKEMQEMGFAIVIVTTQAGIGLGYFTKEDFFKVNKIMLKGFNDYGIRISKIYFCPHSVLDYCICRKPNIGLIEKAKEDLNIKLQNSWVIGDKTADILAGKKAGCRTILVLTGHAGQDREFSVDPDFVANDLQEASEIIKKNKIHEK